MHDRHGNPIEVGDVVRGWGTSSPHQIVGPVLFCHATADTCNIGVGVASVQAQTIGTDRFMVVTAAYEYGTAKEFEVVRKSGAAKIKQGPFAGFGSEREYEADRKASGKPERQVSEAQPVEADGGWYRGLWAGEWRADRHGGVLQANSEASWTRPRPTTGR